MDVPLLVAEALSGPQAVLLGLGLLVVAFVMRRSAVLNRRSRSGDRVAEIPREVLSAEQALLARIHELEVRLHDQTRETEARAATRIAQLNQLVMEAERAIARLEALGSCDRDPHLQPQSDAALPPTVLCSDSLAIEQRMIVAYLLQSGYSPEQVARLVNRPCERPASTPCRNSTRDVADAA